MRAASDNDFLHTMGIVAENLGDRTTVWVAPDGFEGTRIGEYLTREGHPGLVLQQVGTTIVHVYRCARLTKKGSV